MLSETTKKNIIYIIFATIISAYILYFASENSIIYPVNEWADVNMYLDVAKEMRNGALLYRDVFDHKGPYLYLMAYIADIISPNGYLGMFIWEVLSVAVFLFIAVKTMDILSEDVVVSHRTRKRIIIMAVISSLLCFSINFRQGFTAEEISLPFLAGIIYIVVKNRQTKDYLERKDIFAIGVISGFLLLFKFTLLGAVLGLAIYLLIYNIKEGTIKRLLSTIGIFFLGIITAAIPVVIYFGKDIYWLFYGYGYMNFIYNVSGNGTQGAVDKRGPLLIICAIFVMWFYYLLKKDDTQKDKTLIQMLLSMFIGTSILSCALGVVFYYYVIPVLIYIAPIIGLMESSKKKFSILGNLILVMLTTVTIITSLSLGLVYTNTKTMMCVANVDRNLEKSSQYIFKEAIKSSKVKDPSLFVYTLDYGYYRYIGINPTTYNPMRMAIFSEENDDKNWDIVLSGEYDFIILDETYPRYIPEDSLLEKYKIISRVEDNIYTESDGIEYLLLQKK